MHIDNIKKELRLKIKQKLQNNKKKQEKDLFIYKKIIAADLYVKAKNIFTYISFNGEVDTHRLIKNMLKRNINIYVPRIINNTEFEIVKLDNFSDMEIDKFGILTPKTDKIIDINKFDLILIPGLAFDRNMNRLGRGKGYFDRFLKKVSGIKMGLCYDFQIIDNVPINNNDIKMDIIISDKTTIKK